MLGARRGRFRPVRLIVMHVDGDPGPSDDAVIGLRRLRRQRSDGGRHRGESSATTDKVTDATQGHKVARRSHGAETRRLERKHAHRSGMLFAVRRREGEGRERGGENPVWRCVE